MGRKLAPSTKLPMTDLQRSSLEKIVGRHKTSQQQSKRGQIILLGTQGEPHSVVGQHLNVSINTVKTWRDRWSGAYGELCKIESEKDLSQAMSSLLTDQFRSGAPPKFTEAQKKQIVALACDKPINHQIEMADWAYGMLALTAQAKGIAPSISTSHVRLILKNAATPTAQERILAVSQD